MGESASGVPDGASVLGDDRGDRLAPIEDLDGEVGAGDFDASGGEVTLRGARSVSSGVEAFPARPFCPETGARDMKPASFGPHATLYSFATIHVSASREVPYMVGYIDFPSGLRAFAHVRAAPGTLRCDMPVTLRARGDEWWVEPRGGAV